MDDCGSSCDGDHGIKHIKTKSLKRIKKKLASQVNEATLKAAKEVEREKQKTMIWMTEEKIKLNLKN